MAEENELIGLNDNETSEEVLGSEFNLSWLDSISKLNSGNMDIPETPTEEEFYQWDRSIKERLEKLNEEKPNDEIEEVDLSSAIEQLAEENKPLDYLVRGALLKCSCGSHERKLNVLKDHSVYIQNKPMLHELDKVEFENIMSFGVCNSKSKYLEKEVVLEKEIKDKNGKITKTTVSGKLCMPHIMSEWLDIKENVRIVDNGDKDPEDREIYKNGEEYFGRPVVTMDSFLVCRHGGLIEPLDSGQDILELEEPSIDWEKIGKYFMEKLKEEYGLTDEDIKFLYESLSKFYEKSVNSGYIDKDDIMKGVALFVDFALGVCKQYERKINIEIDIEEIVSETEKLIDIVCRNTKFNEALNQTVELLLSVSQTFTYGTEKTLFHSSHCILKIKVDGVATADFDILQVEINRIVNEANDRAVKYVANPETYKISTSKMNESEISILNLNIGIEVSENSSTLKMNVDKDNSLEVGVSEKGTSVKVQNGEVNSSIEVSNDDISANLKIKGDNGESVSIPIKISEHGVEVGATVEINGRKLEVSTDGEYIWLKESYKRSYDKDNINFSETIAVEYGVKIDVPNNPTAFEPVPVFVPVIEPVTVPVTEPVTDTSNQPWEINWLGVAGIGIVVGALAWFLYPVAGAVAGGATAGAAAGAVAGGAVAGGAVAGGAAAGVSVFEFGGVFAALSGLSIFIISDKDNNSKENDEDYNRKENDEDEFTKNN